MAQTLSTASALAAFIAAGLWLWASLVVKPPLTPKPDERWSHCQIISDDLKTGKQIEWGRTGRWQSRINAAAAFFAAVAAALQGVLIWP